MDSCAALRVPLSLERRAGQAILALRGSRVELPMGVHLPIEDWADARIGQSLEINISFTIVKMLEDFPP